MYCADLAPAFTSSSLKTTVPRALASAAASLDDSSPRTGIASVRTRKTTATTALIARWRCIGCITVIDLTGDAEQPPRCGIVARANGGVNGASRGDWRQRAECHTGRGRDGLPGVLWREVPL